MKKYIKRKLKDINIGVRGFSKFHNKKIILFANIEERKKRKSLISTSEKERKLECVQVLAFK